MKIALATLEDVTEIAKLYDIVVDDLEATTNYPGWKKGIYPTYNEALAGVEKQQLYVIRNNDIIIGTITINNDQETNYQLAKWNCQVPDNEVYVIHTLAVHPQYKGKKIAQKLLQYAEHLAKTNGIKTIRLDVRKGNLPAIKLYSRCGYLYVGEINLDFRGADLGLFELYEKVLP